MHDDTFLTALTGRFDAQEERLRSLALRMTGCPSEAGRALAAARAALARKEETAVRTWLTVLVGRECVRELQRRGAAGTGGAGAGEPAETGPGGGERDRPEGRGEPDRPGGRGEPDRRGRRGEPDRRGERGPEDRQVVERFLAAARARDARTLAAVLDPDVVAHWTHGPVRGAPAVAERAAAFARRADATRTALVGGAVGAVAFVAGSPVSAVTFVLRRGRVVTLSLTTGEDRVRALGPVFPER